MFLTLSAVNDRLLALAKKPFTSNPGPILDLDPTSRLQTLKKETGKILAKRSGGVFSSGLSDWLTSLIQNLLGIKLSGLLLNEEKLRREDRVAFSTYGTICDYINKLLQGTQSGTVTYKKYDDNSLELDFGMMQPHSNLRVLGYLDLSNLYQPKSYLQIQETGGSHLRSWTISDMLSPRVDLVEPPRADSAYPATLIEFNRQGQEPLPLLLDRHSPKHIHDELLRSVIFANIRDNVAKDSFKIVPELIKHEIGLTIKDTPLFFSIPLSPSVRGELSQVSSFQVPSLKSLSEKFNKPLPESFNSKNLNIQNVKEFLDLFDDSEILKSISIPQQSPFPNRYQGMTLYDFCTVKDDKAQSRSEGSLKLADFAKTLAEKIRVAVTEVLATKYSTV